MCGGGGGAESMWESIWEMFICERLYLNQFAKLSSYSIGKVAVGMTTPAVHAHEPLGLITNLCTPHKTYGIFMQEYFIGAYCIL